MPAATTGIRAFAHAGSQRTDDDVIAYQAETGVATITTLAVTESFSRRRFDDLSFLEHPLLAHTMPPWFIEDLTEHATAELDERGRAMADVMAAGLEAGMDNVRRAHEAGVLLVAGTDSPYPGVFYGESLHRELELLVEAGLSPLEAITVATHNAAVLMGAEDEWGSLAPGLAADLLLIAGRPDLDISDTRELAVVVQGGRVVDRGALEFDPMMGGGFRQTRPMRP